MKIALVVHDLHEHGGHSYYSRMLADECSRRHDVTVFANRCERPIGAAWAWQQVPAIRASALAAVYTFPIGLRKFEQMLAGFDVRHMQGYCGGNPNAVTAHICVAAYLASLRNPSRRTRLSLSMMARAERRFYRRLRGAVIAVSRKVAEELRTFYGFDGTTHVIPHGVDLNRFSPTNRDRFRAEVRQELAVSERHTVALYVGDLTKAHAYLRELSLAAPSVHFLIISRSQDYRWEASNVKFLPPTRQVERYYAAADALVFPTTYDSFGMVVLEAMASGLPVFASDRAGASELFQTGVDGFALALPDWVEATRAGLQNRSVLQAVGCRAAHTASLHVWARVAAATEGIYDDILLAGAGR